MLLPLPGATPSLLVAWKTPSHLSGFGSSTPLQGSEGKEPEFGHHQTCEVLDHMLSVSQLHL